MKISTFSLQVWHNYGFDRHVLYNEGIDARGFAGALTCLGFGLGFGQDLGLGLVSGLGLVLGLGLGLGLG
eukprot:1271894-Amorphochlora_amoeboformis.AAC.1